MAIERGRRLPFVVLPWAVLEHPTLTGTDVMVYATIARFADNQTGTAWPSRSTIATFARCSLSTVDRSVEALIEAGFLTKQARRTKSGSPDSNLYLVHEIAEAAGGVAAPVRRGSRTGDDWGSRTSDDLTRTSSTRSAETPEPSEWTLPPDDVKAQLEALGIGAQP
jgi:hypothetical protein